MILWWLLAAMVLVGHLGLNLACYNRINATALPRHLIKAIELFLVAEWFVVSLAMIFIFGKHLLGTHSFSLAELPIVLVVYSAVCLLALVYFGIPWLYYRPVFGVEWLTVDRKIEMIDMVDHLQGAPCGTTRCRLMSKVPLNEIFHLAVEEKETPIPSLPEALVGLKIAHISDVHLTGHVLPSYFKTVAEEIMRWQPDLVALTGDIIDRESCIEWLPECFGAISAPDGCYFVLGNHDRRVPDPAATREAMQRMGWTDLGGVAVDRTIRGIRCELSGTEVPWFGVPPLVDRSRALFRIVLSHSPDQIVWARLHRANLMLAGHTHGGHGRLPLIGPLLSPSRFGSRYASGEFYVPPTVMHVTRGLSGTHLMRISCPPEVSLLTLVRAEEAG